MEVTLAKSETVAHSGPEVAFEEAFKSNFKALHAYAHTVLQDELMAEEIVQTVFLKLWENRDRMSIHTSLRAYLYKSVYNESLNYLKHKKVQRKYMEEAMVEHRQRQADEVVGDGELRRQLHAALQRLPEKCRTVFQLSRFEELRYQEIADRLDISVKTVEAHMGKALKLLRMRLADFLPLLIILLPNLCCYG
ncbi:MAG TPA: RNA polymerase sigma-70 factor [Parapedobacter sp.]|uniref:RNA polymerase sigma-70 factor n=1 Tax=Parapedobacter sp. TaxID=1958893 RepID=UPI002CC32329|nr:RNA polymerase sigma-70 factor [Parapedobacter sp.]HWK56628.1 RNA polymerase sigma-70 factor [Parapedobacter sp.]